MLKGLTNIAIRDGWKRWSVVSVFLVLFTWSWALSLLAGRRAQMVLGQSFHLNSLGQCSHLTHQHSLCAHNMIVLFHDYRMRIEIKQLRTVESTVHRKGQLLIIYIFRNVNHAHSGETSVTRFVSITVKAYVYGTTSPKSGFPELTTKLMRKIADVSQRAEGGSGQWGSAACADTARAAPGGCGDMLLVLFGQRRTEQYKDFALSVLLDSRAQLMRDSAQQCFETKAISHILMNIIFIFSQKKTTNPGTESLQWDTHTVTPAEIPLIHKNKSL